MTANQHTLNRLLSRIYPAQFCSQAIHRLTASAHDKLAIAL